MSDERSPWRPFMPEKLKNTIPLDELEGRPYHNLTDGMPPGLSDDEATLWANWAFSLLAREPETITDEEKQWFFDALKGKEREKDFDPLLSPDKKHGEGFYPFLSPRVEWSYKQRTPGDNSLFTDACKKGHLWALPALIEAGVDIEYGMERFEGYTGLMLACEHGHTDIVEYLLEGDGFTPAQITSCSLHTTPTIAAWKNHVDILKLLHKHGAKFGEKANGRNPLKGAAHGNAKEAMDWLLEHVVDAEADPEEMRIGINEKMGTHVIEPETAFYIVAAYNSYGEQAVADKKHIAQALVDAGASNIKETYIKALRQSNLPVIQVLHPLINGEVYQPFFQVGVVGNDWYHEGRKTHLKEVVEYLMEQGEPLSDISPMLIHSLFPDAAEYIEFLRSIDAELIEDKIAESAVCLNYISNRAKKLAEDDVTEEAKASYAYCDGLLAERLQHIKTPGEYFRLHASDISLLIVTPGESLKEAFSGPYWRRTENAQVLLQLLHERGESWCEDYQGFVQMIEERANGSWASRASDSSSGWARGGAA